MNILSKIDDGKARIQSLPDTYVILSGKVQMTNIYGALLLEIISDAISGKWLKQLWILYCH